MKKKISRSKNAHERYIVENQNEKNDEKIEITVSNIH